MTTPDLRCGVILDESITDYHASFAWSKSKLDTFRKCALKACRLYVDKSLERYPPSKALIEGAAFAALMEGKIAFDKQCAVIPSDAPTKPDIRQINAANPSLETVRAIKWWSDWNDATGDRIVIDIPTLDILKRCREGILKHPVAKHLLAEGRAETTYRVKGDRYHLQCRTDWDNLKVGASLALVDALRKQPEGSRVYMEEGEPYVVDIKTCASLVDHMGSFQRNFASFGYHRQGPFYRGVMKDATGAYADSMFFVAVEKTPMASVTVFSPDDDANVVGWSEVVDALQALNTCYDTGVWPDVPEVQIASLPGWYGKA